MEDANYLEEGEFEINIPGGGYAQLLHGGLCVIRDDNHIIQSKFKIPVEYIQSEYRIIEKASKEREKRRKWFDNQ